MKVVNITLKEKKKIYFASDFHLGAPNPEKSLERELKIIKWIDEIKFDAQTIVFNGDVFDFWFEYKYVIPKGFVRFQAKLYELAELKIQLMFFKGNHDLWMFDYFEEQYGAIVSRKPIQFLIGNKKLFVVHGDGYGPGDSIHKAILLIFESRFFQKLFTLFPSNFAYWIAETWSKSSRASHSEREEKFLGEKEWLWSFAKETEKTEHHDYYVFGHRHLPLELPVSYNSIYINLGDWLKYYTYGVFDGNQLELKVFGIDKSN
jgi:UDP-2,3-diacylglucosamine hydrolase